MSPQALSRSGALQEPPNPHITIMAGEGASSCVKEVVLPAVENLPLTQVFHCAGKNQEAGGHLGQGPDVSCQDGRVVQGEAHYSSKYVASYMPSLDERWWQQPPIPHRSLIVP